MPVAETINYKKKNPEYATDYGVTVRQVMRWKKMGYPLDEPGKMPEKLGLQRSTSAVQPKGIMASKELKLRLECEKLAFNLAVAKGEYIAKGQISEDITRMATAQRAALMRLENDLPGVLAGLGEAAIQKIIRETCDQIMRDLSDVAGSLYQTPPCSVSP